MKLELETEFKNNLSDYFFNQNMNQLSKPHDPKDIICYNLIIPITIKLYNQIDTPILTQLDNIHI